MKEIGLSVGKVTYKESAQYADGTIISQSPASPKKVDKGTKVNLVVCRKSEAEKAAEAANEAPNTSGMTLEEAEKALESAGYSVAPSPTSMLRKTALKPSLRPRLQETAKWST